MFHSNQGTKNDDDEFYFFAWTSSVKVFYNELSSELIFDDDCSKKLPYMVTNNSLSWIQRYAVFRDNF